MNKIAKCSDAEVCKLASWMNLLFEADWKYQKANHKENRLDHPGNTDRQAKLY